MSHQRSFSLDRLRFLIPTLEAGPAGGRVRLRTLVLIRWVAVSGQLAALAIVYVSLGYDLPIVPALALVAASALVNVHASLSRPENAWLGDRSAAIYLAYDLVQLTLLLSLTGGLINPFAILILAPVIVSASVLSRESTFMLAGLSILAASLLGVWHWPLPWPDGALHLPGLYVLGHWFGLVMAVIFITAYVYALAQEAQRKSDALSATQMALAREQRLSALGGLAAAAAHELGSPLSTIAVVAREMATELPEGSSLKEDAELLLQESARCREILTRLASQPEDDGGAPFNRLPLSALVETAAGPYRREGVTVAIRRNSEAADEPEVGRSPELLHGLGMLVQNAVGYAEKAVEIEVAWDGEVAWISVRDDGPGFASDILPHLGEPYISSGSRNGEGEHMGLGIFIARTLLSRTGAEVSFRNERHGGAAVEIRWPREALNRFATAAPPQPRVQEDRSQWQ